jgi:hypothetical protein
MKIGGQDKYVVIYNPDRIDYKNKVIINKIKIQLFKLTNHQIRIRFIFILYK